MLPSQAEWEMLARWLLGAGVSGHKDVSLAYSRSSWTTISLAESIWLLPVVLTPLSIVIIRQGEEKQS